MITPQQLLIIGAMSVAALLIKLAYDTRADWLPLLDNLRAQYAEWLAVERERTAERAERRAAVKSQPLVSITLGRDHSVKSSSESESSLNAGEAHSHALEATGEGSSQLWREGLAEQELIDRALDNLTCADMIELAKVRTWTREQVVALLAALHYLDGSSTLVQWKKEEIAKFVGIRAQTAARIIDQTRGVDSFVFVKSHPERESYVRTDLEK